jgi:hypothetical protein
VSEQDLLERLWARVPASDSEEKTECDWTIVTSRASSSAPGEHKFGTRIAFASPVRLRSAADLDACWIESVDAGWLFLLACGAGSGFLLSVGEAPELLLRKSGLVEKQLAGLIGSPMEFAAYPRIQSSLCGPGWLACGSAAMTFDPVYGEGASNAVREAILASAAVKAIAKGSNPESVLDHYSARLTAGFLRHLESCRNFYVTGNCGPFWESELRLLDKGINWMRGRMKDSPRFQYRLIDFDLHQIAQI